MSEAGDLRWGESQAIELSRMWILSSVGKTGEFGAEIDCDLGLAPYTSLCSVIFPHSRCGPPPLLSDISPRYIT